MNAARTLYSRYRADWPAVLAAVGLAVLALFCYHLFTANIDYALGHNSESSKKALFVLHGTEDFFHPILMLRTVKWAAWLHGATDPQDILIIGREVSAMFSMGLVIASFLLARCFVTPSTALACAAATAFAPLTVVHAHYFKEDTWMVLFTTLAMGALVGMIRQPSSVRSAWFGIVAGLAMSSKYIGAGILVLAYFVPRFAADDLDEATYRRAVRKSALVAVLVFCLVDMPLFFNFSNFAHGLGNELIHPFEGHIAKILPFQFLWTFHLTHSLLPGMTAWLLVPGLAGLGWLLVDRKRQPTTVRALLAATVVYYLLIETTPMKPFPDFMRYALPLVPFLAVTGGMFLERLLDRFAGKLKYPIPFIALCLLSVPAYSLSTRYNQALVVGTRDISGEILDRLHGPTIIDRYTRDCLRAECRRLTHDKVTQTIVNFVTPGEIGGHSYRYAAISSFQYDRIMLSARMWIHYHDHEAWAAYYRKLLQRPRLQIKSALPPMGFIDPTIQIVDLGGGEDGALKRLAAEFEGGMVRLKFLNGKAS